MAAQSNAERQKAYRERNATKPAGVTVTRKPRGRRKPTANKIASNIQGILELGNATAFELVPAFRADALRDYEIELLSKALAGEILDNAVLLKYYQSFGSNISGPHTVMAAAIIAVALPRLARRGMVPEKLAGMGMGLALTMGKVNAGEGSDITEGAALQDGTGTAHFDYRPERVGEVSAVESPTFQQEVSPNFADKA